MTSLSLAIRRLRNQNVTPAVTFRGQDSQFSETNDSLAASFQRTQSSCKSAVRSAL